ncbi:uncharacterized protein LOC111264176 [Varroa jacobsoni]|uniref:Pleiotrophin/Midkine C-terminal domain-containing protein n=1 Tax=Varroa destructor TaxID=109461 RepID=A0A7M7MID7_VARDE|nr:uncharacterized protein LOC111252643 isoform X1 [Varroa destructor]XP_022666597.1 uncharacterized protein LOC111252643 isoform X1 [Varroa destructor]XP_022666598.1 uncharacterized protein LOC111252643 isoform X1 [Varroa destructor]XP_022666599.1 uncharacterized protein LOC111252643 isoform X1 [Varroa destructor]XP_022695586.1 uncharacterized protein LOC111264176 [Varroa jacobsoni]XP_022695587.1 uncharacterized protein LOC111264176 [Varroa jacobsoni]XP_022695588.1 uncharacterized protein LO
MLRNIIQGVLLGVNCLLFLVTPGGTQSHTFERAISHAPARSLDSTLAIQLTPLNPSSHEDRFHISRVERVRYGKAFRRQANPPQSEKCKYKKEPWGECEMASNIQRRRLVLKKNNPACEPTREITRPCRLSKSGQGQSSHNHKQRTVVCRYKKGSWSECDPHTGLKTRTDTLKFSKQGLPPAQVQLLRDSCEPTRMMTRKCKATKLGCKYNRSAAWSKCDSRTNLRTKVLKLEAGVNRSGAECEPERRITKNCRGGQPDKAKKSHDHFPQEDHPEEEEEIHMEVGQGTEATGIRLLTTLK